MVCFGNLVFQFHNPFGARVGISVSGQLQYRHQVFLIFLASLFHLFAVGDVILAIRKLQSALQQIGRVVRRVVEVRCSP